MSEPNEHQDRLTRNWSTLCWVLPFGKSGLQGWGFILTYLVPAGLTKLHRRVSSPDAPKTSRLLMAVLPGRSRV